MVSNSKPNGSISSKSTILHKTLFKRRNVSQENSNILKSIESLINIFRSAFRSIKETVIWLVGEYVIPNVRHLFNFVPRTLSIENNIYNSLSYNNNNYCVNGPDVPTKIAEKLKMFLHNIRYDETQEKRNYFIQNDNENNARRYAAFLWNWNINTQTGEKIINFVGHCIRRIIEAMNTMDLEVLLRKFLPSSEGKDINEGNIKKFLIDQIKYPVVGKLIWAIHEWYMIMPLLLDLAKFTTWDILRNYNAFLLGADILYDILCYFYYKNQ